MASLRAQQYYAHPQNHFWRILRALWPQHPLPGPQDYAARCAWLLARGLGLWDVYGACERGGSLDARIRNAEVNDLPSCARCPGWLPSPTMAVRAIGMRATAALGVPVCKLPSTSPGQRRVEL